MEKNKLFELLSVYIKQKNAGPQSREMKKVIRQTSDEELGDVLSGLWNEFEQTENYDAELKANYKAIERRIRNKHIWFKTRQIVKYAAVLLLPVLSLLSAWLLIDRSNVRPENSEFSVRVAPGESSEVRLPDGSEVKLNAESEITYCDNYQENKRMLQLKGEAVFKVAKNKKMPFVVTTEYLDVEVLGTTFNVKTYESDNLHEVALVEGSVKLSTRYNSTEKSIYLEPNQKAVFNKSTGKLTVKPFVENSELAWTKGILVFQARSLLEINLELERKFGVEIQMNYPDIEQDLFTGTFENQSIADVLNTLRIHYGFDYSINQKVVSIYPTAKKTGI